MKKVLFVIASFISACASVPQALPPTKVERVGLSWEAANEERRAWSDILTGEVASKLSDFDRAADMKAFCPKYASLSDALKIKAWGELWVAVSYFESGHNPKSASVDVGTKDKRDTWSVGLFQMSVVDQKNYGLPFGFNYDDLLTAGPNIKLALAVMRKQIVKRGLIVVPSNPYWAVLYNGKYSKIEAIKMRVQKNAPACL